MTITEKIDQLNDKLVALSRAFSGAAGLDAEDLYQSMIVVLLERASADPEFVNQNDSYIVDAARKYACRPLANRARRVFDKYEAFVEADSTGDTSYIFDTIASPGRNPEDIIIELETARALVKSLDLLSGRESQVVGMIVEGLGTNDIAARMGVAAGTVSTMKKRVIRKISASI